MPVVVGNSNSDVLMVPCVPKTSSVLERDDRPDASALGPASLQLFRVSGRDRCLSGSVASPNVRLFAEPLHNGLIV